ncbi:LysR family transcriptional regulator, partial [Photobacterium sp. DNB23_23_1]
WVSGLKRNDCPDNAGIGVRFAPAHAICMMPRAAFEKRAKRKELVEVLPDVECPTGKAFLVWADRKLIATRVVAFRDMIFERFGQSAEFLASINSERD